MILKLKDIEDDILIVAHSLGGVYALHLATAFPNKVKGGVTMSTPYGGSKQADALKWFPPFSGSQLLKDISPEGAPILASAKIKLDIPWVNLVTIRGGTYWIPEPNDGVVTLKSMKHRDDMQFVEVLADHFEITQSPESAQAVKEMISRLS
jgi:pimeloyl-ACP methyl ester carboxylesterase